MRCYTLYTNNNKFLKVQIIKSNGSLGLILAPTIEQLVPAVGRNITRVKLKKQLKYRPYINQKQSTNDIQVESEEILFQFYYKLQ